VRGSRFTVRSSRFSVGLALRSRPRIRPCGVMEYCANLELHPADAGLVVQDGRSSSCRERPAFDAAAMSAEAPTANGERRTVNCEPLEHFQRRFTAWRRK
jgi:hypothetical protein